MLLICKTTCDFNVLSWMNYKDFVKCKERKQKKEIETAVINARKAARDKASIFHSRDHYS